MKKILLSLVFGVMFFLGEAQSDTVSIDDYYVDFAVPDLTALGILGIQSDEIVRPGNMKEFAAALANFVDTDGSLKPALAMEWSFMRTFTKQDPVKWSKRWQPRNLALSMATTDQDSLGLRLGVGLKWVPFDGSDPMGDDRFYNRISELAAGYYLTGSERMRFAFNDMMLTTLGFTNINAMTEAQKSILDILLTVLDTRLTALEKYKEQIESGEIQNIDSTLNARIVENAQPHGGIDEIKRLALVRRYTEILFNLYADDYEEFGEYISRMIKEQKEKYREQYWNAKAWEVSAGWVGHSLTSTYGDFTGEKFAVFSGIAFPTFNGVAAKRKGQIIAQVKYNIDVSGDSIDYSGYSIGARHLYGNSNNRLSVEVFYSDSDTKVIETAERMPVTFLRYLIGAELKLADGTWLELGFGGQKFFEGLNEKNAILTNFGFKHAIRNKRRYDYQY